ncbi:unnamed protein product, partial [Ectocarpus fasciculatus]
MFLLFRRDQGNVVEGGRRRRRVRGRARHARGHEVRSERAGICAHIRSGVQGQARRSARRTRQQRRGWNHRRYPGDRRWPGPRL